MERAVPQEGRSRCDGFTLLEILIVLVIIAMAATLVAPAVDAGLRAREVRSAVRNVAGTMRALQAEAVQKGTVRRLAIHPVDNAIEVEGREPIELGEVAHIGDVRGGELLSGGVVRVSFYPNGSNTGVDLLLGERGMPPSEGFVVRADPLLGLVTIVDPGR